MKGVASAPLRAQRCAEQKNRRARHESHTPHHLTPIIPHHLTPIISHPSTADERRDAGRRQGRDGASSHVCGRCIDRVAAQQRNPQGPRLAARQAAGQRQEDLMMMADDNDDDKNGVT